MTMRGLRALLLFDALLLFLLGGALIFAPRQVTHLFHFEALPVAVDYLIGLWGCALLTMAAGYAVAATDPIGHVIWIQVAIGRGAIEVLLGLSFVLRGLITWQQAGFGIIISAAVTVAYLVLYPRRGRTIKLQLEPALPARAKP